MLLVTIKNSHAAAFPAYELYRIVARSMLRSVALRKRKNSPNPLNYSFHSSLANSPKCSFDIISVFQGKKRFFS